MRLIASPCHVCGQPVMREERKVRPGARIVCDRECQAVLSAGDAGHPITLETRLCLRCGETFRSYPTYIGLAHTGRSADICPACWREGLEGDDADGRFLDSLATFFRALEELFREARKVFWEPRLRCPRCGERHRREYEWSCRYPLATGLCEGLDGEHVHSVCYRCGYEVVRLETKAPPAGLPTRGAAVHGTGASMSAPLKIAMSPDSTTSRR